MSKHRQAIKKKDTLLNSPEESCEIKLKAVASNINKFLVNYNFCVVATFDLVTLKTLRQHF